MNAWIERGVSQLLKRQRIRFVCAAVLTSALALQAVCFGTAKGGVTAFGTTLGADFVGFYVAGKLLNEHGAAQLYDLGLQNRIRHDLMPGIPADDWLPFRGYSPLIAVCFQPLALLPFAWSYLAWLAISAGFYLAGFTLVWKTLHSTLSSERSMALLLALSFEPFLMETWAGGQLSSVGFFCMALAISCADRRRPALAGGALALCLYKPTLLLWIAPMLLIGRRWKTLIGFCAAGGALAGGSVLVAGPRLCRQYVEMLTVHLRDATLRTSVFADWKLIDLVSFVRLLTGGNSTAGLVVVVLLFSAAALGLTRVWLKAKTDDIDHQHLLWAFTLTCTLAANVFVGVYDMTLVVISALLTMDVLFRRAEITSGSRLLLLLLYVVPWFSGFFARTTGVQLDTLILIGCAVYQLRLASRPGFSVNPPSV